MLKLPHDERVALLRDPAARAEMRDAVENYNRDPAKGTTVPPPLWTRRLRRRGRRGPSTRSVQSRSIADIADELGVAPADAMLDLALDEDLATRFRWRTESPEWAAAVGEAQLDPRMIIGTSDGGAHLARDDGADWSSYFLALVGAATARSGRSRRASARSRRCPRRCSGSSTAACIAPGGPADMMIFDPETIGPWKKEFVHDLPGGVGRFKAWGTGVQATIVNGEPIVLDGELTGRLPGQVVRPGVATGARS